jgi:selenocysteine lyase/cysteine desulfurase
MSMERRRFLRAAGLSLAGSALARPVAAAERPSSPPPAGAEPDWPWVRDQFDASREWMHFASFYIASHPRPVREAIESLRREIDSNPYAVVEHGIFHKPEEVRRAAAEYLGGRPEDVALVRSTTEGLAFVYAGLAVRPGQELLTTVHDHYSHHESARLAARRSGATLRRVPLYDRPAEAREGEIVERLRRELRPLTRSVGVTWVHSSTGVKLPVRRLAEVVAEANRSRAADDRILLIVDGVHGFGAEDETVADMGADFFCAGTHKWIFGPRGTGIVWGRREAWAQIEPTVPAFEMGPYTAWMDGNDPGPTQAAWVSPGGFHAYEHAWALPAAFAFHRQIGRPRVAARIRTLNTAIKDGLAGIPRVTLHTPRDPRLSAGLVAFEVEGFSPEAVVERLAAKRIVASTSPYKPSYVRLAGSLLNTPDEVEAAVRAVRELA